MPTTARSPADQGQTQSIPLASAGPDTGRTTTEWRCSNTGKASIPSHQGFLSERLSGLSPWGAVSSPKSPLPPQLTMQLGFVLIDVEPPGSRHSGEPGRQRSRGNLLAVAARVTFPLAELRTPRLPSLCFRDSSHTSGVFASPHERTLM